MELEEKIRLAVQRVVCLQKSENISQTLLVAFAIVALSTFTVSQKLLLRSRGSRFTETSYYLLIHFEQAAYALSCLFHPSQQDSTS